VGYELKRKRFEELHREAVRWPMGRFTYVGIDGNWDGSTAQEGESIKMRTSHTRKTCTVAIRLCSKRRSRNPFSRFHSSSPELRSLFDWCPAVRTRLFEGPLPWDSAKIVDIDMVLIGDGYRYRVLLLVYSIRSRTCNDGNLIFRGVTWVGRWNVMIGRRIFGY